MPRGKTWSAQETLALVEAFVHVSEDPLIGTNQSSETLYDKVAQEAKHRYRGDFAGSPKACRGHWRIVSKEIF